jgi:hypothetical protein
MTLKNTARARIGPDLLISCAESGFTLKTQGGTEFKGSRSARTSFMPVRRLLEAAANDSSQL